MQEKTTAMAYNLYIDNVNARAAYGVVLADGAHRQLFEPPAFKTPDSTEWPEHDGAEYDLEAPVLAGRTLSIPLHVLDASKTPDLVAALADGAYHEFRFEFGVSYNYTFAWRLVSVSSYRSLGRLATLTLSLAEDEWVMWYKDFPAYPGDTPFIRTQGYALDGLDFSRWGLWVLDGTAESLARPPGGAPSPRGGRGKRGGRAV